MTEHRRNRSEAGEMREQIRQMQAQLAVVTGALAGREPPRLAVAETGDDGQPVMRPVVPRRRAAREALEGRPPLAAPVPAPLVPLPHPAIRPFPGKL